jgi:ABC-2 type transport system permease protein
MYDIFGLFVPILWLPISIRPLSYILPMTYGVDILHGAINGEHILSLTAVLVVIDAFCMFLFWLSLLNIRRRWIA